MAGKKDYHLILMDINMPIMDGLEATRTILKHKQKTKIIFVSTFDNELDKKKAMESGAIGYIEKPITMEVVENTIYNTLHL